MAASMSKNRKYRYMCKRQPKHVQTTRDIEKLRMAINELINNHPESTRSYTVKQRIDMIKQPKGGYIKPSEFKKLQLDGGGIDDLNPNENIAPGTIGSTVDYLTRFMTGKIVREAFEIPRRGAKIVNKLDLFDNLVSCVHGLDDDSIIAAVRLSGFDPAYRAGPSYYKPAEQLTPDQSTIENVRTMVNRSLSFFTKYGPVIASGLTFDGGYTQLISSGDGDFLTDDTLWDFKVSKNGPQSKHTLQLLIYWRMGIHSIHCEYKNIKYLGIYNPRQNIAYRLSIDKIPEKTIIQVDDEIIGYTTADTANNSSI